MLKEILKSENPTGLLMKSQVFWDSSGTMCGLIDPEGGGIRLLRILGDFTSLHGMTSKTK
jgi:hypothetical protein